MKLDDAELKKAVETLLFITDQALGLAKIGEVVGERNHDRIAEVVAGLMREHEERGAAVQILEIAGGFQMATRSACQKFVRKLYRDKMTMRLSTAALETVSIIAYKQPITRGDVEDVRGVDAGAVVRSLLERKLIKMAGQKEVPGRPMLYGTTRRFLEVFGLESLEDLPSLRQLEELAPRSEPVLDVVAAAGEGGAENAEAAIAIVPTLDAASVVFDEVEPVGKPH